MFESKLGGTPVIFSRFYHREDANEVITRIAELLAVPPVKHGVLFVSTMATEHLVAAVHVLSKNFVDVFVRDNHDFRGIPSTPKSMEVRRAGNELRTLLGKTVVISNRQDDPTSSGLFIRAGEFSGKVGVVVADPSPSGLLGAMKALMGAEQLGGYLEVLDRDAGILDSTSRIQVGLSPLGRLLGACMYTIPPFKPRSPGLTEAARKELFTKFLKAVLGDTAAHLELERKAAPYEAAVDQAIRLAAMAVKIAPGVMLADARHAPAYDLVALAAAMAEWKGTRVTAIRRDKGAIATVHGEQFSLGVVAAYRDELDLRALLPLGPKISSPAAGIINKKRFLLHVSRPVWKEQVLPALEALSLRGWQK